MPEFVTRAGLPSASMDISGKLLREVEFRDRLRGYDTDEVDEFLEKVALAVDGAEAELTELRRRAEAAEARIEAAEARAEAAVSSAAAATAAPSASDELPTFDDEAIRRTLILAQRTADLAVSEARAEATQLLSAARAEADSLLNEAERRARRLTSEADQEFNERMGRLSAQHESLREEINALEQVFVLERARLTEALSSALEFVTGTFQVADDVAERSAGIVVPEAPKAPVAPEDEPPDADAAEAAASPGEEAAVEESGFVVDLGSATPGEPADDGAQGRAETDAPEVHLGGADAAGAAPRALLDLADDDLDLEVIEAELNEDAAAAHVLPPWEARRPSPPSGPRLSGVTSGDDPDEELWARWVAGPEAATDADPAPESPGSKDSSGVARPRGGPAGPGAGIFKIDRRRGGS